MKSLLKKILIILSTSILFCLIFSLVGCSQTDNPDNGENNGDSGNETPIEAVAEITSFDGATIDGEKISMFVEHEIDSVSLSGKVQVSKDCIWKLYSDKLGRNEIPTKVATSNSGELLDGDNQFYILVSSNTEDKINFYELTIHRSYEVDITYWFNDEIYKTEKVFTGHPLSVTEFNVEHYKLNYWQDKNNDKIESPVVWGDMNLYANATYLRKIVSVKMNIQNVGEISGGGEFYEGETIQLTAFPYLGYEFAGWYDGESLVSESSSTTISVGDTNKTYVATFSVLEEMSNFIFTSYKNQSCNITGIVDETVNTIIVPDYVISISQGAFRNCLSVNEISLPFLGRNITTPSSLGYLFGDNEFADTTVPDAIKTVSISGGNISNGAFSNCTNIVTIILPLTITAIPKHAFYHCESLTNIVIPDSVTRIEDYAFDNCISLQTINIPKNVHYIGYFTFNNCVKLVNAIFSDTEKWSVYCKTEAGYYTYYKCEQLSDPAIAAKLLVTYLSKSNYLRWDKTISTSNN